MNGSSYARASDFVRHSYPGLPADTAPLVTLTRFYLLFARKSHTSFRTDKSQVLTKLKIRFYRWDELLANHDTDELSQVARIEALAAKGDGKAASSQLKTLRLTDASVSTLLLRARVGIAAGRYHNALSLAQEAVSKEGGDKGELIPDAPALQTFGHAYYAMRRYTDAAHIFQKELGVYPNNGRALYGLWQSLQASGQRAAAADARRNFNEAWAESDVVLSMDDL